jgi:hypothetical protein
MKRLTQLFFPSLVLLLSACGSNIQGTYSDGAGNTLTFKPQGKMSIHTGSQDLEFDYTLEGTKITVRDLTKLKGFRLVNFLRVLDDGSLRSLDGTRLSRQGK